MNSPVPASGRAWQTLLLSFFFPGAGQLRAGRRRTGAVMLGIFVLWVLALVGLLVTFFVSRRTVLGWALDGHVTRAASVAVICYGVFWLVSVLHAWWIGRPDRQPKAHGLGLTLLAGLMSLVVVWATSAVVTRFTAVATLTDTVLQGGGDTTVYSGRVNVLLLGGDAGSGREGMRADSLNVVSINLATGRAVIIGIPRNLQHAPFPADSPMHEIYPDGFYCPKDLCLINAVNTYVSTQYADKYPGVRYPGVEATKEAVEGVTGLKINYYVMLDLGGFVDLVDAVGGITVNLPKPVPVSGNKSGTELKEVMGPGEVHLDGEHALRLARSRYISNDYVRMQHQRCIMQGMLHRLDPMTVLEKFTAIAEAGRGFVSTDVPGSEAGKLAEIAIHTRALPIKSIALVPPLVHPKNPDFAAIHQLVAQTIADSEALDSGGPTAVSTPRDVPRATPTATTPSSKKSAASKKPTKPSTQTAPATTPMTEETAEPTSDDLAALCTAG